VDAIEALLLKTLYNATAYNAMANAERQYYQAREAYLKNTLRVEDTCEEDLQLPEELRVVYSQNGKNLKCPEGTSSPRNSRCLGQCTKVLTQSKPVSVLNPVNSTRFESSNKEGRRALQE